MRSGTAPTQGVARVVRVGVLGGTSMLLASAAHVVGGGELPSVGVLAVAGILLGLVAVTVTARRCRTWSLLSLLALQQALLHLLFDVASRAASACPGAVVLDGHHAPRLSAPMSMCAPAPGMPADTSAMHGWAMLAGHAAATVLTALLLARGESFLWRLADRIITSAATRGLRASARRQTTLSSASVTVTCSGVHAPAAPRGPPVHLRVS